MFTQMPVEFSFLSESNLNICRIYNSKDKWDSLGIARILRQRQCFIYSYRNKTLVLPTPLLCRRTYSFLNIIYIIDRLSSVYNPIDYFKNQNLLCRLITACK